MTGIGRQAARPDTRQRRAASSRVGGRAAKVAGFTLIEVIVAFVMLALALTLLLGTLTGSTRQVRHAQDAGRAALHAQSLLDQAGIGEPLRPGRDNGELDDGRYRWTLQIVPWNDPARADVLPTAGAPQMMELVLDIEWGDAPRQRLQSRALRLTLPERLP